jgi:hypothetical protein
MRDVLSRPARRLTALAALLFAFAAFAAPTTVTVKVDVVDASNQGSEVQPANLRAMKDAFTQSGFNYKSYRQLSSEKVELAPNAPHTVKLPNGRTATLKLLDVKDNVARIQVSVPPLETTYSLGRSGSVFLQAGPHKGGMLVLVLSPVGR